MNDIFKLILQRYSYSKCFLTLDKHSCQFTNECFFVTPRFRCSLAFANVSAMRKCAQASLRWTISRRFMLISHNNIMGHSYVLDFVGRELWMTAINVSARFKFDNYLKNCFYLF